MPDDRAAGRRPNPGESQRTAADPGVSAWVNASAGSGKTKVLTDRVLALLLAGARPHAILCLTFTKAAAGEMANRVADRLALWARAETADLRAHLTDLLGGPPDAKTVDRARRLFARVQEEPGGVRINTVHAFCQAVLQRFPVEARVPPHFDILAERDQRLLLNQARDGLVRAVGADPDSPLAVAWDRMLERLSETSFDKLAGEIVGQRSRLHGLTTDRVAHALGLPEDATPESVARAACADAAFDAAALRSVIRPLATATAGKAQELADALSGFLGVEAEERDFPAYAKPYLRADGQPLKLGGLNPMKNDEAIREIIEAEQARIVAVQDDIAKATALADTAALLTVSGDLLVRYAALKKSRSLLDYDDLILGMKELLIDPGAAWVHYKLDRGIDHVLVDEAQDTNPEQWRVIASLVAEFFAGEGAAGRERTLFAVGDPKQSIYSFQGADPQGFIDNRGLFAGQADASKREWRDVPLNISFRSAAPVLALVDAVFAEPQRLGVGATPVEHSAWRSAAAGWVEVWPVMPAGDADAIGDIWQLPRTYDTALDAEDRLAHAIAQKIRDLIDSGETLDATDGRPIRAGDIMVLVRRRRRFGQTLVTALKRLNVPVAGMDRMALARQLAVRDLTAFGQFLLLPEDDLTLATVLKGPFFRWDEDRLFRLAHARSGSLWQALRASEAAEDRADARRLAGWLRRVEGLAPFQLFSALLTEDGGRAAIRAYLGPEADDPVDEFLTFALDFPNHGPPTLQHFLHWLAAEDEEVKRELDAGERDEVRLLTVHAAKGLQAPIVFLPDTMRAPEGSGSQRPQLSWQADVAIWGEGNKQRRDSVSEALIVGQNEAATAEEARLLYVALTRAEDRLYVSGWEGRTKGQGETWYRLVSDACERLAAAGEAEARDFPIGDAEGQGYVMGQEPVPGAARAVAAAAVVPLPDWALTPAPAEPAMGRPLAPSRPSPLAPALRSPLRDRQPEERRFRRGTLLHRLLQHLPGVAEARRAEVATRLLADAGLTEREVADHVAAVAAVLDDPRFAPVFAEDALAEAPLTGVVAGAVVSGTVDRLLVTTEKVLIVDYKTNRTPPRNPAGIPDAYARQMRAYAALLGGIYPDRTIEAALLWTEVPRLDPVDVGPASIDETPNAS